MKSLRSVFACAVVAVTLLAAGLVVAADGPTPEAIENAKTAADHNAIAQAYDDQAKSLRAQAELHERMGTLYGSAASYKGVVAGMVNHCNQLTTSFNKAADQAEAMAKMHRQLAAQAPKS